MVDIFMRPTARNTAAPPSRRKPGSRAIAVAVAVVVAFPLSARTNSGAVPGPEGRRTWMCAVFRPSQDGESENPRDDETIGLLCRGSAFLLVTFLWQDKEKLPAASVAEAFAFAPRGKHQQEQRPWIPAYAGMTTAGMTVAGMTVAGMTVAGMTVAGMTVAGMTVAGMTVAGMTVAGMTVAGMTVRVS